MSKVLKKELAIILLFVLLSVLYEIVTFSFLGFGASPKYILFNVAFWVGFSLFLFIFPNKIKIVLSLVVLLLQGIIGGVNASLYHSNGDVFDLETVNKLGEGVNVASPDVFDIACVIVITTIFVFGIIAFIYLEKSIHISKEEQINRKVLPLALLMAFSCPVGFTINQIAYATVRSENYDFSNWQGMSLDAEITMDDINETANEIYNEQYQYDNLNFRLTNLKTYGTFGFYLKNLEMILSNKDEQNENEIIEKTLRYINNGNIAKVNMGTSEGNNVITILLESAAYYGIDPYMTPNLYALSHTSLDANVKSDLYYISNNTLKLDNFYSRNSTNVSEQYVLLGSFPYKNDGYYKLYSEEAKNMKFDFSLANVIKEDTAGEVRAEYYHPSDSVVYQRNLTIKSFGFDETVMIEDMKEYENHNYQDFYNFVKDSDFMTYYADKIIDTNHRFYSHITTITTHGSYLNKDERHIERMMPYTNELLSNWDKVMEYNKTAMPELTFPDKNDGDFYTEFVNYKSAMMDLDKAIGILFDKLNETGVIENTTVCLYSDHYCYYNDLALQMYGYKHNDFTHSEIYRIPAFIFDMKLSKKITNNYTDLENLHNKTFSMPSVILPTLLDILNIEYNTSYYLNCSIFDDNSKYNAQIGSLNGMFDENFFSFNIFDIENSLVEDRIDYNNLKQRFYCNAVYTYAKIKYQNNFYAYNQKLFK